MNSKKFLLTSPPCSGKSEMFLRLFVDITDIVFGSNKLLKMAKANQEWPIVRPENGVRRIIIWL